MPENEYEFEEQIIEDLWEWLSKTEEGTSLIEIMPQLTIKHAITAGILIGARRHDDVEMLVMLKTMMNQGRN